MQGVTTLCEKPPKWDIALFTLFSKSKYDPSKNNEDVNLVLPPVLDQSSAYVDEKGSSDSEDKRPLSWNLSKKGSSSSTKASSGTVKYST